MKKEEDMLDKEEDMLDMSPGGLYPTNRVVSVEQRWGKCPKWLPQCDEVQEEDHEGVDERRINMILHDFPTATIMADQRPEETAAL